MFIRPAYDIARNRSAASDEAESDPGWPYPSGIGIVAPPSSRRIHRAHCVPHGMMRRLDILDQDGDCARITLGAYPAGTHWVAYRDYSQVVLPHQPVVISGQYCPISVFRPDASYAGNVPPDNGEEFAYMPIIAGSGLAPSLGGAVLHFPVTAPYQNAYWSGWGPSAHLSSEDGNRRRGAEYPIPLWRPFVAGGYFPPYYPNIIVPPLSVLRNATVFAAYGEVVQAFYRTVATPLPSSAFEAPPVSASQQSQLDCTADLDGGLCPSAGWRYLESEYGEPGWYGPITSGNVAYFLPGFHACSAAIRGTGAEVQLPLSLPPSASGPVEVFVVSAFMQATYYPSIPYEPAYYDGYFYLSAVQFASSLVPGPTVLPFHVPIAAGRLLDGTVVNGGLLQGGTI